MDTITRAKTMIEAYTEERLFDRDGTSGAQFSLRNNFSGWNEETKTALDEEEQRARIKEIEARTEALKQKMNPDEEETEDDGFLEALKGEVSEVWEEE